MPAFTDSQHGYAFEVLKRNNFIRRCASFRDASTRQPSVVAVG